MFHPQNTVSAQESQRSGNYTELPPHSRQINVRYTSIDFAFEVLSCEYFKPNVLPFSCILNVHYELCKILNGYFS